MKDKDQHYYVVIKHVKTKKIEKVMGPFLQGKADRVCSGVSINMSDDFFAIVVDKKPRTPTNGRIS